MPPSMSGLLPKADIDLRDNEYTPYVTHVPLSGCREAGHGSKAAGRRHCGPGMLASAMLKPPPLPPLAPTPQAPQGRMIIVVIEVLAVAVVVFALAGAARWLLAA